MKQKALIFTDSLFETPYAKTAHGLIRGSKRYQVVGLIDYKSFGQDAGFLLDGIHRNIPIFSSIDNAISASIDAEVFIIGVASMGGGISDALKHTMLNALSQGLDLVSGLHTLLCENQDIVDAAFNNGRILTDVRRPKKSADLHFWSGGIKQIKTPRVAVLGTDCGIGKRTTAKIITEALRERGIKSHMIYTGQTGWLQGLKYGFILDATPNDFVSGELEHAILQCNEHEDPDIIILEGQSSLRNPSGPCGAEFLVSAGAQFVILQAAPSRDFFTGLEDSKCHQYSLKSEVDLIQAYGATVISICLNTEKLSSQDIDFFKEKYRKELQIPVISPLDDSVNEIINTLSNVVTESTESCT